MAGTNLKALMRLFYITFLPTYACKIKSETTKGTYMKVVINIGHGAGDPGAVADNGYTEYEFNKELAAYILMYSKNLQIDIINQDTSGLEGVIKKINSIDPAIVISLHSNASIDKTATGTETLVYPGSLKSAWLGNILQQNIIGVLKLKNRGLKERDKLAILKGVKAPAVIVEPFFLSNPSDLLNAKTNIHRLAQAIVDGINQYEKLYERK